MLRLKYPSKEFGPSWRKAVNGGTDFEVDARIIWFLKPSMKFHIDAVFGHLRPDRQSGSVVATLFTGEITTCIAMTTLSGKYDAEYTDTKTGLLIAFRLLDNPGENRLLAIPGYPGSL